MGLRFRKSFKIAPGVRVNVGKKSSSVSFGGKGLRHSISTNGRRTTTVGIPGSGLSYSSTSSNRQYKTSSYQQQNELKKRQREAEKLEEIKRNKLEVELFENQIERIHSIHKECDDEINWEELATSNPPFHKGSMGESEAIATANYENFKPNFFEKLFKTGEKKRNDLKGKIEEAQKMDLEEYQRWEELKTLAGEILKGNTDTYLQVIEEMSPLEDLSDFGSGFEFFVDEPNFLEVEFDVESESSIPKQSKMLTKTGKVSVKEMPKTKYYDLLQDYVCSCSLRIARDMFALLPIDYLYIHANDNTLDTSTGYVNRQCILSVKIDRDTLHSLNLEHIDCSDSMKNFEHAMNFKKTKGFESVEKLI